MFFTLLGTIDQLAITAFGIVYPAFKSFEALEAGGEDVLKLWLTYWVCFAAFMIVDQLVGKLLLKHILPFYFFIKLAFLIYLFHPETLGASKVYLHIVQPMMKGNQIELIHLRNSIVDQLSSFFAQD